MKLKTISKVSFFVFVILIFVFSSTSQIVLANGVDILTYTGDSFNIGSSGLTMAFSHDGMKMYRSASYGSSTIYQYDLSSAWDVTTAVAGVTFNAATTGITGIYFSTDGTKMFVNHFYADAVYQYSLSSAWNVNSASYDSVTKGWSSGNHYTFTFKQDGTSVYEVNSWSDVVKQYDLSSAWDLSTAGSAVATLSTPTSIGYYKTGAAFSSDGTKLYLLTTNSSSVDSKIKQYDLSSAWDVSTGVLSDNDFDLTSQSASMKGLYVDSTNQHLFAYGQSSGVQKIFRYLFDAPDTTDPVVSVTDPTVADYVSGAGVTLTASATDDVAVAGTTFYVDSVVEGSEDTSSPYSITWDSTGVSDGEHTVFAVARDTSDNYATSTTITFSVLNEEATFSSLSAIGEDDGATITWTSSLVTSSKINYGLTSNLDDSTSETDTSPRVLSHSVALSDLQSCTSYYYQAEGDNAVAMTTTSSTSTFTTTGCVGDASISDTTQEEVTIADGGSLDADELTLTIPADVTTTASSIVFQANQIDGTSFLSTASSPSGKTNAGTTVFNLKALDSSTTTVSTFDEVITIVMTYIDSDVSNLDESTLQIYRYDGSSWTALSNCSVNPSANTVSCETDTFSDFAIFGDEASSTIYGYYLPQKTKEYVYSSQEDLAEPLLVRTDDFLEITPEKKVEIQFVFNETLRPQMTHSDIKELQKFLNNNGFVLDVFGAGSPGNETNYFGPKTQNALIRFQETYSEEILSPIGLTKGTGIFGPMTRGFVNDLHKNY